MFFKNESVYKIGMDTKQGTVVINPGDVVRVLDADIITVNEFLTETTEEEFNTFRNPNKKDEDSHDVPKDDTQDENKEVVVENDNADNKTDDKEEKEEDKTIDTTTTENGTDEVDNKIAQLKELWNKVTKPAEKAKIAKQIKKLQKK